MNDLDRACWFASWCHGAGYKKATRKWLIDALVLQWMAQAYGDQPEDDSVTYSRQPEFTSF